MRPGLLWAWAVFPGAYAVAASSNLTASSHRSLRGRPHNHPPAKVFPWRELLSPPPPGAGLADSAGPVDLKIASRCLKLTPGGDLHLSYPDDAEAHFEAIRLATKGFAQSAPGFKPHQWSGYGGPWIENAWIDHFEKKWAARTSGQTLSTFFGPFVPIFLPWVDRWVQGPWKYPPGMIRAVQSLMRKSVAYITVSQNDEGLAGR